jgi:hypothetical protein
MLTQQLLTWKEQLPRRELRRHVIANRIEMTLSAAEHRLRRRHGTSKLPQSARRDVTSDDETQTGSVERANSQHDGPLDPAAERIALDA